MCTNRDIDNYAKHQKRFSCEPGWAYNYDYGDVMPHIAVTNKNKCVLKKFHTKNKVFREGVYAHPYYEHKLDNTFFCYYSLWEQRPFVLIFRD